MSRSYKKVGAASMCSSRGDKQDRTIYHRAFRRKARTLLKDVDLDDFYYSETDKENPSDNLITKGIDFSLKCSDKWSWSSDGGAFWQEDESSLRKEFDAIVFGLPYYSWRWIYHSFPKNQVWSDYVKYRAAAQNKKHSYYKQRTLWNGKEWLQHVRGPKTAHSDWALTEMLFYRGVIPFSFWGPTDLTQWLRAHQEEIIKLWLKLRYLRK